MEKAVSVTREDLNSVRTGRANPAMFSRIVVDYYGSPTPLNQLASVSVPEARMAVIKPYDASQLRAMEKAIRGSDLGSTRQRWFDHPGADPAAVRERRREMVKVARGKVRTQGLHPQHPRKAMEELHRISKEGEAGEDEVARAEKELQGATIATSRRSRSS